MDVVSIETLAAVRIVLGEAFATDPLLEWVFPEARHRREASAAWLGLLAEGYLGAGRVDTVEDHGVTVAVAAWHIPDDTPMPMPTLPSVPGSWRHCQSAWSSSLAASVRSSPPYRARRAASARRTEVHRLVARWSTAPWSDQTGRRWMA